MIDLEVRERLAPPYAEASDIPLEQERHNTPVTKCVQSSTLRMPEVDLQDLRGAEVQTSTMLNS